MRPTRSRPVPSRPVHWVLGACLALGACSGTPAEPAPLDAEEVALVNEVVELMHLRVERARDPEGAEARREALGPAIDPAELDRLVDELSADPRRAHLFMQAIRDSLGARRLRWFPPETVEPTPRVGGTSAAGDDEDASGE